jgi:hybrid cluster-associated redox disulfide protein
MTFEQHETQKPYGGPLAEKITKDMIIEDVVRKYPKTIPVFMAHGLHCIGCHIANYETIAEGAMGHGLEDVSDLIKDLNETVAGADGN